FSDVIHGLRSLIDFIHGMDGTSGIGSAASAALEYKLPLLNRSVSDLVNLADDLAARLDAIEADPAGSVQELETLLRQQFHIPSSVPTILSFDPETGVLDIDLDFVKSIELARPFHLDLADAGLPPSLSFLTDVVGVNASGYLDVSAGADVRLGFGLDLSGPDQSFFLYTDPSKTHVSASADVSGNGLNFEARLGPFGVYAQGGSANLGGSIGLGLVNA